MKKTVRIAAVLVSLMLLLPAVVFAAGSEYKPEADPLVSLSYVNEVLKPQLISEIKKEVGDYQVVYAKKGQKITAASACELFMTTGSAVVFITDQVNLDNGIGLNDLTSAGRILNGEALPRDHYIIIPRADGRGVTVTSDDAYFMVRGEYTVE